MPSRIPPTALRRAWRVRLASGTATLALVSSLALVAPVIAQDGTGGAAPLEETSCVLVPASEPADLLAGTDVAATPAASPMASPVASPVASPIASPVASPVATPITFDAGLLTEDLTASTTSLASCLSEGRFHDAALRTSPDFRGQLVGNPRPLPVDTFAALASMFPATDYQIVEIANVAMLDETTARADIVWQVGHQVRVERWQFSRQRVEGIASWVVQHAEPAATSPTREAAAVTVTIADNAYSLKPASIAGDTVDFRVTNTDAAVHELLVLRLDTGVSTDVLLTTPGPDLPAGVTFIGQATIPATGAGRLLLADLEPGTYTIVDLLPGENGLPHLSAGMEGTFEVQP